MNTTDRRAVFLDRDGVINAMVYNAEFGLVDSPANPEQFSLLPGVGQAIAALNTLGLYVFVVSNQPGIAKGKFTADLLEATTAKMVQGITAAGGLIDEVFYCLHHPQAQVDAYRVTCDCRKPGPGLLTQAAQSRGLDPSKGYMVGDGITDIQAGKAVGATTIFVSSQKCYICDSLAQNGVEPDYMVADLSTAAYVIKQLESGATAEIDVYKFNCKLEYR